VEYRESIYVGYRYYDSVDQAVLFPFGHGLSYTTFEYSDLQVKSASTEGEIALTVSLKVKNSGAVTGQEVVQLYVRDVESTAFRPDKELKGFAKVALQPGEEKEVALQLDQRAFAYYNTGLGDWHVESGAFEILVGASSRDIRLAESVQIESTQGGVTVPASDQFAVYGNFPRGAKISQADFEKLLGRPAPVNQMLPGEPFTLNTPIGDMESSFVGRQIGKRMQSGIEEMIQDDPDSPTALLMRAMIKEAPLRLMLMMGEGMNRTTLEALLLLINGRILKGLWAMLKAVVRR
jgi:beta-glucosidase